MTKRDTDSIRTDAALYALGALSPDEARAFEQRLADGDAECRRELDGFRAVVDDLGHAAPAVSPAPTLRHRVLDGISNPRADEAANALEATGLLDLDGVRFVRSDRFDWLAGPLPGIDIKLLSFDRARGRRTLLLRLAPGAVYPAHRHADVEEIYLLEGELTVCGVRMRPGDYCRAKPDSVHEDTRSEHGCVFMVTASVHDQLIA